MWSKAHELMLDVYRSTSGFPPEEMYGLTNPAEGCGRRSAGEMARYIQIAMGSGSELSYHFYLARDLAFWRKTTPSV